VSDTADDPVEVHGGADAGRINASASQIVLVFQGGGALGAYQAGVYQALHEEGIEPDWVIGTSIGAINASLIAGNEPAQRLQRLEEFWRRVTLKDALDFSRRNGMTGFGSLGLAGWPALSNAAAYWSTVLGGIDGFFTPNPLAFWSAQAELGPDQAAFYSTAPLEQTLEELVDFSLLSRCKPRLTVGAAHVRTSMMHYFDSRDCEITARHVMASGALPPAFPAVRIDGELYWDGGILSNTPTEAIFDDHPRRTSLVFAVHMWNPMGPEPRTIWEVLNRQKDIQYSSRVVAQISRQRQLHKLRHVVSELVRLIPESERSNALVRELASHGCLTRMHVMLLLAPRLENENCTKDIDFSPSGIRQRWDAGYADTRRAIERSPWEEKADPLEGVIIHGPFMEPNADIG
jgi:NTE family protein